jgi:hypothetical protein
MHSNLRMLPMAILFLSNQCHSRHTQSRIRHTQSRIGRLCIQSLRSRDNHRIRGSHRHRIRGSHRIYRTHGLAARR